MTAVTTVQTETQDELAEGEMSRVSQDAVGGGTLAKPVVISTHKKIENKKKLKIKKKQKKSRFSH